MAKKAMIEREKKRQKLVDKFAAKRADLKAIARNQELPMEERFAARLKLAKLPRNSSANPTKSVNGKAYWTAHCLFLPHHSPPKSRKWMR